jgi:hypothetical protein
VIRTGCGYCGKVLVGKYAYYSCGTVKNRGVVHAPPDTITGILCREQG